jgi:thymidine kinase
MSLTVYTGPMFSGKTSMLIKEITKYADISDKRCTLLINHVLDTRDEAKIISSHSSLYKGLSEKVDVVSLKMLSQVDISNYTVIGIDESNFFLDLVESVLKWLKVGKHIICVGLDSDHQMRPFGKIKELLHVADSFVKLTAVCSLCNAEILARGDQITPLNIVPAPFTDKITADNDNLIDIGGNDKYIAVCRKHHKTTSC